MHHKQLGRKWEKKVRYSGEKVINNVITFIEVEKNGQRGGREGNNKVK